MVLHERLAFYGTLLGLLGALGATGCTAPQAKVGNIDPQAEPILKKMCNTLDAASAFKFNVTATMDRPVDTGQLAQFHRNSEVTVARPDRLYANTDSDEGQWAVWYQGKSLTILDKQANAYATQTVPDRIGKMLDYMVDQYDLEMPMADLLVGGTYDSLTANVESGSYLGLHSVGDVQCHHLLFRQENIDWQIWIDAGEKPLPRKLLITYKLEPNQPQYIATIDGWDLSPTVSAQTFTFTAPTDSKTVTMAQLVEEE